MDAGSASRGGRKEREQLVRTGILYSTLQARFSTRDLHYSRPSGASNYSGCLVLMIIHCCSGDQANDAFVMFRVVTHTSSAACQVYW